MKYLIDSDYVIDFLTDIPHATQLLGSIAQDGIAISLITVGEILEGIYYGKNPQKSNILFRKFLKTVDVLSPTQTIIKRFALIRGDLRRKGQIIGDFDILIAATALRHNLTLVTRNIKDYQRIPQFSIYK